MSYMTLKPKTRDDLDRSIRDYRQERLKRALLADKVCDVVEGFCEHRCEWVKNTPLVWNSANMLAYRPVMHEGYFPGRYSGQIPSTCPCCLCETFKQFEILEGGGV